MPQQSNHPGTWSVCDWQTQHLAAQKDTGEHFSWMNQDCFCRALKCSIQMNERAVFSSHMAKVGLMRPWLRLETFGLKLCFG